MTNYEGYYDDLEVEQANEMAWNDARQETAELEARLDETLALLRLWRAYWFQMIAINGIGAEFSIPSPMIATSELFKRDNEHVGD